MHLTYDGYRFGGLDVYCPWDVVNYADSLRADASALPQPYWINTSGNALVRRFIDRADKTTQNELERLIAGEPIEKAIHLNLTYNEIDNSIGNLWSVLFTTGYLTSDGRSEGGGYRLKIPNREVREIFVQQIRLRRYDEQLRNEGRTEIKAFGIAFCRKRCRVACADG
ncbi:MAG: hypothetical protein PUE99_09935 [Anaerovibrio sp.]|nr:hypothetical protein [Anaerovibrio sp.]